MTIEPCDKLLDVQPKHRWDCLQIELLVQAWFRGNARMIVPNVSWGLRGLGHEADMLILKRSGWMEEVEIKVSRSDLKADANKRHGHRSDLVRALWFAFPEKMLTAIEFVPPHAGILVAARVRSSYGSGLIHSDLRVHRNPQINKTAHKPSVEQIAKLGELGCYRIWTLKRHLRDRAEMRERNAAQRAIGGGDAK